MIIEFFQPTGSPYKTSETSTSLLPYIPLNAENALASFLYIVQPIFITNQKEIFCIVLLNSLREIETPCNHRLTVSAHDLVVGDGVLIIYFVPKSS